MARQVEHDATKGELYVRQALMLPNAPFVAFKRDQGYLNVRRAIARPCHAIVASSVEEFERPRPSAFII